MKLHEALKAREAESHANKFGSGAKKRTEVYGKHKGGQAKVGVVMHEWKKEHFIQEVVIL